MDFVIVFSLVFNNSFYHWRDDNNNTGKVRTIKLLRSTFPGLNLSVAKDIAEAAFRWEAGEPDQYVEHELTTSNARMAGEWVAGAMKQEDEHTLIEVRDMRLQTRQDITAVSRHYQPY